MKAKAPFFSPLPLRFQSLLLTSLLGLTLGLIPSQSLAQEPRIVPQSQYFALVQAGLLLYNPRQEINGYQSSTQIDFIQGVQIWPQASLGIGLGLSVFEVGYLFPVYADLRGDLMSKRKISPHYFGQIGYNFEGFPEGEGLVGDIWHSNYEAKGGFHYGFGGGIRVKTEAQYDWLFTMGVRNFKITERDQLWGGSWTTTHLVLQRLSLGAGIRF